MKYTDYLSAVESNLKVPFKGRFDEIAVHQANGLSPRETAELLNFSPTGWVTFRLHVSHIDHTMSSILRRALEDNHKPVRQEWEYHTFKCTAAQFGNFIILRNQQGKANWVKDLEARYV